MRPLLAAALAFLAASASRAQRPAHCGGSPSPRLECQNPAAAPGTESCGETNTYHYCPHAPSQRVSDPSECFEACADGSRALMGCCPPAPPDPTPDPDPHRPVHQQPPGTGPTTTPVSQPTPTPTPGPQGPSLPRPCAPPKPRWRCPDGRHVDQAGDC